MSRLSMSRFSKCILVLICNIITRNFTQMHPSALKSMEEGLTSPVSPAPRKTRFEIGLLNRDQRLTKLFPKKDLKVS